MSRRKALQNSNYDIFPMINNKKETTKSENGFVTTQFYYDLFDLDSENLFKKVQNRSRFKEVIKLVSKLKKISAEKQSELRHIYIIEASNKQDLLVAASYISLQLEQSGFIEASKIINVSSHDFFTEESCGFGLNNGMSLGMLYSTKEDEKDDEEEYKNPWNESDEAILSFFGNVNQLPSYDCFNSVEQYPIFLLIDESMNSSFAESVYGTEDGKLSSKDKLFQYISAGAFHIQISNLKDEEFTKLLKKYLIDKGYILGRGVNVKKLTDPVLQKKKILSEMDIKLFGDAIIANHLTRNIKDNILTKEDFMTIINNNKEKVDKVKMNPYDQLTYLVGLGSIKKQINDMIIRLKFDKYRKEAGLSTTQIGFNAVFLGSPGTAKTTVARIIAQILEHEKFIESSAFREVKKSDIVGMYVGWTAAKIDGMFTELSDKGGVIFFDEIYTLSEDDSTVFDKEAITAIVQNMENHRNVFCIFAGYQDRMQQFLSKNPGLRSRISFTFKFEDYSSNELIQIFESHVKQHSYILPEGYKDSVAKYFDYLKQSRRSNFGNGREARTLFELSTVKMASRLNLSKKCSKNELMEIKLSDIKGAIDTIISSETSVGVHDNRRKIGFCS